MAAFCGNQKSNHGNSSLVGMKAQALPLTCASRKFLYDSFRVYQEVPKNVEIKSVSEDQKLQLLNCSINFRCQLRTLAEKISSLAEVSDQCNGTDTANSSLDDAYDSIYSVEKSWHICEIFFLNPTKLLSIELLKWLKVITSFHNSTVAIVLLTLTLHFVVGDQLTPVTDRIRGTVSVPRGTGVHALH